MAVGIPDATRTVIDEGLRDIRKLASECGLNLRWVEKDALHLTLAFVASVDPLGLEDIGSAIETLSADTQLFDLALGGGGAFPGLREPSILWLGVTKGSGPLISLAEAVQVAMASVGYPQSPRPYRPHLTIARSRRIQDVGAIVAAASAISAPPFRVPEVVLYRSHLGTGPARYERLAGFALKSAQ